MDAFKNLFDDNDLENAPSLLENPAEWTSTEIALAAPAVV